MPSKLTRMRLTPDSMLLELAKMLSKATTATVFFWITAAAFKMISFPS